MKSLSELTEREVLALAISSEEEDSRIYLAFAEDLAERYPASASVFEKMAEEEEGHRHRLLDQYQQRFGSKLPPIRREDVKGFLRRRPIWLTRNHRSRPSAKKRRTWNFRPHGFMTKLLSAPPTWGSERFLATLLQPRGGTKAAPRSSRQNSSRPRQEQRRRRLSGGCLSCNMCSPASPA
jgi:erythrin-vacuolar iron transport family protein